MKRPKSGPVHTTIEPDQLTVLLQLIDTAEDIFITVDKGGMRDTSEVGRGFLWEIVNAARLDLGFEVAGRLLGARLLDRSGIVGTIMIERGLARGGDSRGAEPGDLQWSAGEDTDDRNCGCCLCTGQPSGAAQASNIDGNGHRGSRRDDNGAHWWQGNHIGQGGSGSKRSIHVLALPFG